MTREEAITHGKEQLEVFGGEHREFIEMAIKALEQEPCEDCVSRAEVLALAEKGTLVSNGNYKSVSKAINELPSVTPKPKTGYWIGDNAYPICPECNCNIVEEYISCSDYAEIYKPMKYCPNCGARMEENNDI